MFLENKSQNGDIGSKVSSEKTESDNHPETLKGSEVTDAIIKAFTVKRRKAMIDQADDNEDNVDYETSVRRLFFMAMLLAFILATLATALSSTLLNQLSNQTVIKNEGSKNESKTLFVPHLILLFNDGSMKTFRFNLDKLDHSWSFKVPKQTSGYMISISNGDILIFYLDGKKDTTVLTSSGQSGSTLRHYTIDKSKVTEKYLYDSKSVRTGNHLWNIGRMENPINSMGPWADHLSVHNLMHYGCDFEDEVERKRTFIWNLEKQKYYPGPDLPTHELGRGCPIGLNRTHVLTLYVNHKTNCLKAWVYSFEEFKWTHMNECLYEPRNPTQILVDASMCESGGQYLFEESEFEGWDGLGVECPLQLRNVTKLRYNLMCASCMKKDKGRKIIVALMGVDRYSCVGDHIDLVVLDLDTKMVSTINHNFTNSSIDPKAFFFLTVIIFVLLCRNDECI